MMNQNDKNKIYKLAEEMGFSAITGNGHVYFSENTKSHKKFPLRFIVKGFDFFSITEGIIKRNNNFNYAKELMKYIGDDECRQYATKAEVEELLESIDDCKTLLDRLANAFQKERIRIIADTLGIEVPKKNEKQKV